MFLSVFCYCCLSPAPRDWTDYRGRQRSGEFVRVDNGEVVIDSGGGTFSVPFENLSTPDQEYVRNRLAAVVIKSVTQLSSDTH